MRILKATLTVTVSFLVLDLLWLGSIGSGIYDSTLGPLRAKEVVWVAAGLFYAQYVAVVVGFAVLPAIDLTQAAKRGLFIGWVAYGTYELTNWAVITDWPAALVPIDITWGLFLTTACAVAGRLVAGPPPSRESKSSDPLENAAAAAEPS